jgi:hypothetical protein
MSFRNGDPTRSDDQLAALVDRPADRDAAGIDVLEHAAADIARANAKIGLQNLAYNIRRLVTLERMAAA